MGYIITSWQALVLLKNSERQGGHPCTKHIGLSNAQLMARLYSGEGVRNGSIAYISTFTTEREASHAASQTFKNIEGDVLARLRRGEQQVGFTDVRTDEVFKARFAFGSGVRQMRCNHMTLVLFSPPGAETDLFFVKTFYPRPPNEMRLTPLPGNA